MSPLVKLRHVSMPTAELCSFFAASKCFSPKMKLSIKLVCIFIRYSVCEHIHPRSFIKDLQNSLYTFYKNIYMIPYLHSETHAERS